MKAFAKTMEVWTQ